MLTGIHILLTYRCTYECDHCFVFGSPRAEGTFTLAQIRSLIEEAKAIGTVDTIYFEGGEPFLFHPLLVAGAKLTRDAGFKFGVVTNGYYGTTVEDATLWLRPLAELGLAMLSVSDDAFHTRDEDSPAKRTLRAAEELGIPAGAICIEPPCARPEAKRKKGEPVVGGGVMFKGRAAENLTAGLPRVPWTEFTECPHEDLASPGRVHVDAFGWVHLCQGVCMGNAWKTPLSQLVRTYDGRSHPIAGPLLAGGPAELARATGFAPEAGYVDACHLCYCVRKSARERFAGALEPPRLYGSRT
jgi:hypothetical protein